MDTQINQEHQTHRKYAVDLFNYVWTLLEKNQRTIQEDDEMLHAAHASRYHWGVVGKPVNLSRGEWQVSRVYATLNRPEAALYHARRSLEICQQNGIGDFDLAYAYEALARASSIAGYAASTRRYIEFALEAGEQIAEQEDKEHFLDDMKTIDIPDIFSNP